LPFGIGLFTCQPAFFTAAEVTGGNSLFHIIVDNVSTATKLIQAFNQQHAREARNASLHRHQYILSLARALACIS